MFDEFDDDELDLIAENESDESESDIDKRLTLGQVGVFHVVFVFVNFINIVPLKFVLFINYFYCLSFEMVFNCFSKIFKIVEKSIHFHELAKMPSFQSVHFILLIITQKGDSLFNSKMSRSQIEFVSSH